MIIHEMSREECLSELARSSFGRLACAQNDQPYIVPIYFVHEGNSLYSFTTRGQKIDWMRSNPLVCVEIDEIKSSLQWMSILVFGRYEELTDIGAHAYELLQGKRGAWWEPGCASSVFRHSTDKFVPIYYRISIDHITGRRAISDF